jgi:iron complex outermembrane receptor protein
MSYCVTQITSVIRRQLDSMAASVNGRNRAFYLMTFLFVMSFSILPDKMKAQSQDSLLSSSTLKKMSLEDLMNIEVTSVSMRPEKLTEVASAVQVISGDDIDHSAATRLPEALRLASNIQIAQSGSHDWAVTARGFNGLPSVGGYLANKLLVTIDGRSVYSPLFGGVFWDVQNVMLADVDKIEVVSGPGGTLWGANAVNGVISVVTKSARETQGLYVSGGTGSALNDFASVRVGARSKVDTNLYYRIYAQHFDQNSNLLQGGGKAGDAWDMIQGGFRMDYYPTKANTFTLQGDFYGGDENKDTVLTHTLTNGQNVLGRFTHIFSETSELKIQAYYDRTWRFEPTSGTVPFLYSLNTYDVTIQHRFALGKRNSILYGIGYRMEEDKTTSALNPKSLDMPVYNAFIQDEMTLAPHLLKLTIGSKFENNVFTGNEFQPCARMAWTPNVNNTVWASVSRAVRTPSRFDADLTPSATKFQSEKVVAYELGYHYTPTQRLSLSVATYFNHYNDLRSLDVYAPNTAVVIANDQRAESWGFEFNGNYEVTNWWHLRGGYTYFNRNIWAVNPAVLSAGVAFESVDPNNTMMFQSIMNITRHFSFDLIGRYVDQLAATQITPGVPAYTTCDARLAWHCKAVELSLVGQNLLQAEHVEVGEIEIARTFYVKITCRF